MYRSYLACFEMGRMGLVRIAQVAPLHEAVPPRFYGGTERVVSYLTEHLVQLGHDVTLFASGDSETRARLVPICRQSLRLDPDCQNPVPYEILALEAAIREADPRDRSSAPVRARSGPIAARTRSVTSHTSGLSIGPRPQHDGRNRAQSSTSPAFRRRGCPP
jgi:Glycosyltransferase Family 4